jgi:hypothetical protein
MSTAKKNNCKLQIPMKKSSDKISVACLASLSNLSQRRIYQLAAQNRIPQPEKGFLPEAESIRALFSYFQREREGIARERMLKVAAERRMAERKDRMEEGDAIARPAITDAWSNIILIFRERMLRIGNNVQSKAALTELQRAAVEQEVSDALHELKKKLVYASEGETDEENVERLK